MKSKDKLIKEKEEKDLKKTEAFERVLIFNEYRNNLISKIKYHQNIENKGVIYDWKLILSKYENLNCPKDVYTPPLREKIKEGLTLKYIISVSERSIGKTTNWLLLGLVMWSLYKTQTVYVRLSKDQITSGIIKDSLFSVICSYEEGRYIKELTKGAYNSVYYSNMEHKAYLQYVDEMGNVLLRENEAFCVMVSVDKNSDYKSGFNTPRGDLIILDEFINTQMMVTSEHVINFLDLTKTISRSRKSPIIVLLANNIARSNVFFSELEITKFMQKIQKGESKIITTERGTKMYIELYQDKKQRKTKNELNTLFYGFKNPKLSSITGEGELFAFDYVQHIMFLDDKKYIDKKHYIYTEQELLRLDICYCEDFGNFIEVHRATRTYNDSVIFTREDLTDKRYVFSLGYGSNFERFLYKMYQKNKIYFSDNEVGYIFHNYLKQCPRFSGRK